MCSIGHQFLMFGGMGTKLFNDVRQFTISSQLTEWKIMSKDMEEDNYIA